MPPTERYSCFHGNDKTLIDHILVSERLFRSARSFEIYNEALRYHGAHVEPIAPTEDSDHALCVAEFALTARHHDVSATCRNPAAVRGHLLRDPRVDVAVETRPRVGLGGRIGVRMDGDDAMRPLDEERPAGLAGRR